MPIATALIVLEARGVVEIVAGRPSSLPQKPSWIAWYIGPSSTMATSICWLPFCAWSLASVSVELPATYSTLTPFSFSKAGITSSRMVFSNEPP